eukprot:344792-Prorocentrum_minimum.AAC.4
MGCGVRASFLWAPHPSNITARLAQWRHERQPLPDVLILSSALWPILHVGSARLFGQELVKIKAELLKVTLRGGPEGIQRGSRGGPEG